MTKKKIVWRLKNRPTPSEVESLVKSEIINKEEAREILFAQEVEGERDTESLKSEIKFLRELVDKLSDSSSRTITTIREIEVPYRRYGWYNSYDMLCNASSTTTGCTTTGTLLSGLSGTYNE